MTSGEATLAATIWPGERCVVRSSSSVPRARSSANTRMVITGMSAISVMPSVSSTGKNTESRTLMWSGMVSDSKPPMVLLAYRNRIWL